MNRDNIYDDLYFRYYNLGYNAYYDKVRFYEEYVKENSSLLYEEKFDLTLDYLLSIFAIGKYNKFLKLVDPIIETIIKENIYSVHEQDLFELLLFKKAAALHNLKKYDASIYISNQLVKINPKETDYKKLLWLAIFQKKVPFSLQKLLSVLSFFGLMTVGVYIMSFFKNNFNNFLEIINQLFGSK